MVCIVRASTQPVLPALAERLHEARPNRIPHALHTCPDDTPLDLAPGDVVSPPTDEDVDQVRTILFALSRDLVHARNSRFGRIRFRHFGLLYWLMDQSLPVGVKDPDRQLREKLRERDVVVRPDERILTAATESVSSVATIPVWARRLLTVIPPLWFALKVSGRIPGISSPYRWFLRGQPNLAPHDPGTFIGFAERLTKENYPQEDREQVMRLLVNAFLEDLRRAYGRWPWRLGGARRMTYAVVLLDGITRTNGGYRLLKLINDVRNETGAFDPLLVVSGSRKVPPYAVSRPAANADARVWDAVRAEKGYEAWCNQFSRDSRSRKPTAWYLPVRVPDTIADPGRMPDEVQESVRERYRRAYQDHQLALSEFTIDRAPLWSRRWVPGLAVVVLAASLAATGFGYRQRHCGELPGIAGARWLTTIGRECVGVSDGAHVFQPTNDRLAAVEHKVHEQNVTALGRHRANPKRPYVTLVYVAALTSTTHPPSDLVTARERLEGVAIAQSRQLARTGDDEPIVRILIANGGTSMQHGPVMAQLIARMAADDPTIVGVVGLDQSRQPTIDVIAMLSRAGLPMVAATLSADRLPTVSPLYFQVSPQNVREADVAAWYADATVAPLGGPVARRVRILASADPQDVYSTNLAEDVSHAFQRVGFTLEPASFNPQGKEFPQPSPKTAGENVCGYDGLIFFAGRQEDFEELLSGISTRCRPHPPRILAGDDVARYVADKKKRTAFSEIPFDYVSFAVGPGRTCTTDDVYRGLHELFPDECGPDRDPSLDGGVDLAYDATLLMINAVTHLLQDRVPLTSGGLWHELSSLPLSGESGDIDFGGQSAVHVPVDKSIAILRVGDPGSADAADGQHAPKLRGFCGRHNGQQADVWCPPSVWRPDAPYEVYTHVIYDGRTYQCRQRHTAQSGAAPPYRPDLWMLGQ
jgi:hypothetical protein